MTEHEAERDRAIYDDGKWAGIKEVVDELACSEVYILSTRETKKIWWLVDETKLRDWGII